MRKTTTMGCKVLVLLLIGAGCGGEVQRGSGLQTGLVPSPFVVETTYLVPCVNIVLDMDRDVYRDALAGVEYLFDVVVDYTSGGRPVSAPFSVLVAQATFLSTVPGTTNVRVQIDVTLDAHRYPPDDPTQIVASVGIVAPGSGR